MKKRILVIANPAASRGGAAKALSKVQNLARRYQPECTFVYMVTENPQHATDLAKANASDYDIVAAFGGDGTINEVAQALVGGDTPLGVLPYGTGNDYARSAKIPINLKSALDLLCNGKAIPTDVGIVNGRYFVNAVGIGFDGRTNYEAEKIRWLRGPVVILLAIIKTFRHWASVPMTVTIDDEEIVSTNYLVDIGNGHSIGGGLLLTPKAELDDGLLHVCHIKDISPARVLLNFPRLKTGTADKLDEVTVYSGKRITVQSKYPLPVHADGEHLGLDLKKLDLHIQPGVLPVIRQPV